MASDENIRDKTEPYGKPAHVITLDEYSLLSFTEKDLSCNNEWMILTFQYTFLNKSFCSKPLVLHLIGAY